MPNQVQVLVREILWQHPQDNMMNEHLLFHQETNELDPLVILHQLHVVLIVLLEKKQQFHNVLNLVPVLFSHCFALCKITSNNNWIFIFLHLHNVLCASSTLRSSNCLTNKDTFSARNERIETERCNSSLYNVIFECGLISSNIFPAPYSLSVSLRGNINMPIWEMNDSRIQSIR